MMIMTITLLSSLTFFLNKLEDPLFLSRSLASLIGPRAIQRIVVAIYLLTKRHDQREREKETARVVYVCYYYATNTAGCHRHH